MSDSFDAVVVGAGAVGTATAYHLAARRRRVLLLEQFELGHTRGSSHGESRIIRHSYSSPDYASLAPAAFEMWRALERESGAALLTMTGGVDLGHRTNPALLACKESLDAAGFGFVWLEGGDAEQFVPQFALPENWAVLWQSGAGILNAGRCVRALAAQAIARGATLLEQARVTAVEPGARTTRVRFVRGGAEIAVEARSVVLAPGPWAARLFAGVGIERALRVTHQQVVYYPVEDPAHWRTGRCPIYIAHGRNGFYGFPVCERPGLIKVGIEMDDEIEDVDEPSHAVDGGALASLNETVSRQFRGIRAEPTEVVTCRYTETADRDFVIDRHPEYPSIVLASPCSGHGFKFSITSGALAAELATTPPGRYESPFWRSRFALRRPEALSGALATEWRD